MRDRAERRKNTWKKIHKRINTEYASEGHSHKKPYFKNLHKYSKDKIICSSPECKTNVEPDLKDQRKLDDMRQQKEELMGG